MQRHLQEALMFLALASFAAFWDFIWPLSLVGDGVISTPEQENKEPTKNPAAC